jgi:hypothetical protein
MQPTCSAPCSPPVTTCSARPGSVQQSMTATGARQRRGPAAVGRLPARLRQLGDYLLTSDGGPHGLACKRALTTPQPCAASSTRAGLILPCMATPTREAARARRPAECRLRSGQRSARQLPSRTQQLLALLGALAVLGLGLPEHRDEFDDLVDTDRIGLHERSVGTDRIRPSLAVEDPGWVGSC